MYNLIPPQIGHMTDEFFGYFGTCDVPKVKANSITVKVGATYGFDATPGVGATGSVKHGASSAVWHHTDIINYE